MIGFLAVSREAEIDAEMEALARKIAEGVATNSERHKYQELSMQRSLLMEPQFPPLPGRRSRVA